MKKSVKILILLLILLLVVGKNIYAVTGSANLTINTNRTEVKVGETVIFKVSASCETGIEGIDATLEYDNTKLELQNINIESKFSNMSGKDESTGEYKLTVISNTTETLTQAEFATIAFKILNPAKAGEKITVELSNIEIGDSQDEWFQVEDKNATIDVIEEKLDEDDKIPGTEDEQPSEDDKTTGTEDKQPSEDNNKPGEEDGTVADKVIVNAGLESYGIIIIAVISIIVYISYKKTKKYKNV